MSVYESCRSVLEVKELRGEGSVEIIKLLGRFRLDIQNDGDVEIRCSERWRCCGG